MRIFGLSLAVLCCVSSATPGTAQKAGGDVVSADQKEIGKLQTHILKYEQGLGVVIQLARPSGADVECNGVCYFPSSSGRLHGDVSPTENATCIARSIRRSADAIEGTRSSGNPAVGKPCRPARVQPGTLPATL